MISPAGELKRVGRSNDMASAAIMV